MDGNHFGPKVGLAEPLHDLSAYGFLQPVPYSRPLARPRMQTTCEGADYSCHKHGS